MKLNRLFELELFETRSCTLCEDKALRLVFDYPNFTNDPRPNIIALGLWRNPSTDNQLLGGINLNFLNGDDIKRLQKFLPLIMKPDNLRDRYKIGRRLVPDVFKKHYRTYRTDYINSVTPGKLVYGDEKDERADAEKSASDKRVTKAIKTVKAKQARQDKDIEKQKERIIKATAKPEPDELVPDEADQELTEPIEDQETDELEESYRITHAPSKYLSEYKVELQKKPLLGIIDIKSKSTLIDNVNNHLEIITEAKLRFDDVIKLMPIAGEVLALHDDLDQQQASRFLRFVPEFVLQYLVSDDLARSGRTREMV